MQVTKETLIEAALHSLLWSSVDRDGDPMEDTHTVRDFSDNVREIMSDLIEAMIDTAPTALLSEGESQFDLMDARTIHRGVMSIQSHGTGLWDDFGETWQGHGEAWHKALKAHEKAQRAKGTVIEVSSHGKLDMM